MSQSIAAASAKVPRSSYPLPETDHVVPLSDDWRSYRETRLYRRVVRRSILGCRPQRSGATSMRDAMTIKQISERRN
ncbi:hypothetical protein FHS21_006000 [Phyllobacterium trifolii]|uniref:Uncharacterized protein n=1 Tax=Phyllobacterium trifolii TaxID=300193 RepID=A0A839UEV6_9HYPH|nr:hypothetical protein [Phyllobacterium trifolii]